MINFILNNKEISTDQPPGMTVLDFVRYHKQLTGTKIGCREGDCGACTVLVGEVINGTLAYQSMTSCLMPLGNAQGKHIVTVEGLNLSGKLNPVQQAISDEGGTQCGICTIGFVVSFCGFCMSDIEPTYENAIAAVDGNICRCTGYKSLERAAATIAKVLAENAEIDRIHWLSTNGWIPAYFATIKEKIHTLTPSSKENAPKSSNGTGFMIGGGTDLYVQVPEKLTYADLNLVFGREDLRGIRIEGSTCTVGAGSTAEDLRSSEELNDMFPAMFDYMKLVSSTPIRNMGTLAGNLVNASPIGDLTNLFLALDSTLVLNLKGKKRTLPLKEFYLGYKTLAKEKEEYIESVQFEIPDAHTHFNFEKVSKRTHLDISSVVSAARIKVENGIIQEAHISAGGVAAIPTYLRKTQAFLQGKAISPAIVAAANQVIQSEVSPISDARGTAEYKRLLLRQLFYAHFLVLFPEQIKMEAFV